MTPLESRWAHLSLPFGPTRGNEFRNVDVVDEFNGPLAIFATLDGQRLFGVVADETGAFERWVFAPVDSAEEAAVRAGEKPLRDALRKASALVVDIFRGGVLIRVAPVDGKAIGDDRLPEPDARFDP